MAAAAAGAAQKKAEQPAEQKGPTGEAVFDSLSKRTVALQKYKLTFDFMKAKTEKTKGENRTCEFRFAGPDLIYLAVIEGDDKGSKVAYNGNKNKKAVRAKQSFMPFPISVGRDDPRLGGFFESDWNSDLTEIKKFAGAAKPVFMGESKIKDRGAYKIEFSGLKGEFDKIDLWADKKDNLLLQYEYYAGGELQQRKTWYDITLDAPLTEADFKP
jgi:outer membrane lipoprotein-sorting protein